MAENDRAVQLIKVEVAYATPERQLIVGLNVAAGCSAYDAVIQSGIVAQFPEIDPEHADMGIFSHNLDGKSLPLPKDYQLKAGDRIEIYRPLLLDPKQARLLRAERVKLKRKS
ncbi:MAG: RnfH family protein [Pseudomonadota bacterium]